MLRTCILLGLFLGGLGLHADSSPLYEAAKAAQANAYCPYSNYRVGCALETADGKIYTGCNVENASWSVSSCSERTAIVKAVSEGDTTFKRIAIITRDGGMACGMCRQMLHEFAPHIEIFTYNEAGELVKHAYLHDLLPFAFGPESLE